ncbi:MAG: hypothetical protein IPI98_06565 [Chitinophagaceae bacterium]|nr:hypothetical protein [Chitinophagaceae bacterium]
MQSGVRYELGNLYMVDRWLLPAFAPIMVGALAAIAAIEFGTYWKEIGKTKLAIADFFIFLYAAATFTHSYYAAANPLTVIRYCPFIALDFL